MAGKKHKSQQFIESDDDTDDSDDDLERELLSLAKKKKPSEPSPPTEKKSEAKPAARERKPSVSDASSSSDDTSSDENDGEYLPNGKPKKKVTKKKKAAAKPPPAGKPPPGKPSTPQQAVMKMEEDAEEPSDGELSSEGEEQAEEGEASEESSEEDGELPSSSSAEESGDSDASDEDLPAFNDGLDENFIGDEDDRKLLEGMSEKDREQELFNRMERREAMKTRMEIERKLHAERKREKKLQKRDSSDPSASRKKHKHRTSKGGKSEAFVGSIAARKGERAKKVEDKKTKALQALQEMKQKRSEKKEKEEKKMLAKESTKLTTKDVFSSDDDDEEAVKDLKKGSDSDSDSDGRSSKSDSEPEEEEEEEVPISTKEQLEPIRLSRHKLERWVHLPFFGELISGCFLRMGIGNCEDKPIYRVVEIVDTSVTSKVYTLGGQRTNKAVKVRHGLQERTFRMEYVSNQGFTESEFSKWKEEMNLVELPLPTLQFIKKKTEAITNAKTYEYKDADVERMVKEKNKFRSNPLNYAVHKNNLMREKDIAEQAGDFIEAQNVRDKLDELEEKAETLDKIRSGALSNVSFINERNRKKNVYDAEKAAIDEGKEFVRSTFGGDNPFIRRRCISLLGNDVRKMSEDREFAKPDDKKENTTPKKPDKLTIASPPETKDGNEPESPVTKEKVINSLLAIPLAAATTATPPQPAPPENENGDADLHLLHDFDVQITVPIPESRSISLATKPSAFHKDEGPPRRSLNLDEYKKRKGLI